MKLGCERHAHELTVYKHSTVENGEPGEVQAIGIYCKRCKTYKRVWPEKAKQYYCRHCGYRASSKPRDAWGCPKCGASTPLKPV